MRGEREGAFGSLPEAFLGGYLHFWYIDAILAMFAVASLLDSTLRMTTRRWITTLALVVAVCQFVPLPGFLIHPLGIFLFPFFLLGILLHRLPLLWSGTRPKVIAGALLVVCLAALELAPVGPEILLEFWVRLICGSVAVVFFVSAFPRVKLLEGMAFYTFTIYLWHPAANAVMREVMHRAGQDSVWVLFVLGVLAGVGLPIVMHKLIARQPNWVRMPLIGR